MLGFTTLIVTGILNGYLVRCYAVQERQGQRAWMYNPQIYGKYGTYLWIITYSVTFWVFSANYGTGFFLQGVVLWIAVSAITYAYLGKRWRWDHQPDGEMIGAREQIQKQMNEEEDEESEEDHQLALRVAEKILKENPADVEGWYLKGHSLCFLGRVDEALPCLEKALELDPGDADTWVMKGFSLSNLERRDEAIECFERAVQLEPDNAGAWFSKGREICLSESGRDDNALTCLERALELKPDNADAWALRGVCLAELGYADEGLRSYEKSLELKPGNAIIWYSRGIAEEQLGRRRDAVRSYEQFITLATIDDEPQIEDARQRLQKLRE